MIFSSVLHEISSYAEEDRFSTGHIKNALRKTRDLLKDGGYVLIRDGLKSPREDLVSVELMSEKVNHEIETAQRCNQWGSLGGDLRALIESTLVSKQNFRAILSQFRASILSTKRHLTRMRPNRRYGFDAMGSQYAYSTRLLVAVDVSGSVPDEDIRKFLAVINRFFKQGIESIEVIEFDSKITTEKPLLLKQAANGIRVIGRGGTNFQPAIDFYYEHEEYDGLVFLTDGYAPTPKLPDDKRHKPLAWILTTQGGNEDNLKPFGPVVRITGL